MTEITVSEAMNRTDSHCDVFVVRNTVTKDIIFQILSEGRFHYYKGDTEDTVKYDLEDTEIECTFEPVSLVKYQKMICDESLLNDTLQDKLYEYIDKFNNIRPWLKTVYEPIWKESLGDDFYKHLREHVKNELYVFCCTFPNVEAYIDNIDDTKEYIKQSDIDLDNTEKSDKK